MRLTRIILSVIGLIAVMFSVIAPAFAGVGTTDLQASNFISVTNVYPGAEFSKDVIVFNPYPEDRIVRLRTVDVASPLSYFPLKSIYETQNSLGYWVEDTELFTVPANGSRILPLTFSVPDYAPAGSYAGGLLVEDTTDDSLSMRMRLYVTVNRPAPDTPTPEIAEDIEVTIETKDESSTNLLPHKRRASYGIKQTPKRTYQQIRRATPYQQALPQIDYTANKKLHTLSVVKDIKESHAPVIDSTSELIRKRRAAILHRRYN